MYRLTIEAVYQISEGSAAHVPLANIMEVLFTPFTPFTITPTLA